MHRYLRPTALCRQRPGTARPSQALGAPNGSDPTHNGTGLPPFQAPSPLSQTTTRSYSDDQQQKNTRSAKALGDLKKISARSAAAEGAPLVRRVALDTVISATSLPTRGGTSPRGMRHGMARGAPRGARGGRMEGGEGRDLIRKFEVSAGKTLDGQVEGDGIFKMEMPGFADADDDFERRGGGDWSGGRGGGDFGGRGGRGGFGRGGLTRSGFPGRGGREGGGEGEGVRGGRGGGRGGRRGRDGKLSPEELAAATEQEAKWTAAMENMDNEARGEVVQFEPTVTDRSLRGWMPPLATADPDGATGNVMRSLSILGGGMPYAEGMPRWAPADYRRLKSSQPVFFNNTQEADFVNKVNEGRIIANREPHPETKKAILDQVVRGHYEAPKSAEIEDSLGITRMTHARDVTYHSKELGHFENKLKSLLPEYRDAYEASVGAGVEFMKNKRPKKGPGKGGKKK